MPIHQLMIDVYTLPKVLYTPLSTTLHRLPYVLSVPFFTLSFLPFLTLCLSHDKGPGAGAILDGRRD